jgi:outer membrane protein OmpA-like peptidoglycan-associated protein
MEVDSPPEITMRRPLAFAVALSLLAPAAALGDPPALSPPRPFPAQDKHPSLQVMIDRDKVDLPGHKLEVKLSRAADKIKLKVFGVSGAVLAEVEKAFGGAAPGTALEVVWSPSSDEDVAKIEVWGYDTDGYYAGVAVTPWKVSVAHEDLNFETDSDVIRPSEAPKLDASVQKIADVVSKHTDLGKITLFVVGHTDTMGSTEHNLALSRKRARAIAAWFKAHGLKSPIAYEGLGKSGLLVKTADQVDEPRNRRVDYILALEPPALPGGDFSWKTP